MGMIADLFNAFFQEDKEHKDFQRRDLTEEDRLGWYDAGTKRKNAPKRPSNQDEVRKLIRHRNPVRWNCLQGDLRWVQKEMKKLGLNPEDARYIL